MFQALPLQKGPKNSLPSWSLYSSGRREQTSAVHVCYIIKSTKEGKRGPKCWPGRSCSHTSLRRAGLTGKVTFEQSPEGGRAPSMLMSGEELSRQRSMADKV